MDGKDQQNDFGDNIQRCHDLPSGFLARAGVDVSGNVPVVA